MRKCNVELLLRSVSLLLIVDTTRKDIITVSRNCFLQSGRISHGVSAAAWDWSSSSGRFQRSLSLRPKPLEAFPSASGAQHTQEPPITVAALFDTFPISAFTVFMQHTRILLIPHSNQFLRLSRLEFVQNPYLQSIYEWKRRRHGVQRTSNLQRVLFTATCDVRIPLSSSFCDFIAIVQPHARAHSTLIYTFARLQLGTAPDPSTLQTTRFSKIVKTMPMFIALPQTYKSIAL